jgi:predicted phosphoribosyltransferase
VSDFANLRDAGRQLGPLLAGALAGVDDPLLLAVIPNGVPVALGIREVIGIPVQALPAQRSDDGVIIVADADLAGRNVVIVDDGVETGTVARAAATAMVESGVASVSLAVPVCSREALATLQHRYDRVVAVVRPMVHHSLERHYDDFDVIDEAEAHRLLADDPA